MKILQVSIIILWSYLAKCQTNLEIGEKAPEIHITNWIKNEPSDKNLSGKFIVLEFWATWCAPCLKSVPHLNELKNKYKNVSFLSLTDEKEERILKTLSKVKFETIVVSDTTKKTFENFKSVEYNDVLRPSIVLIDDKGYIKWVGYPAILNEKILNDFLSKKLKPYNYFTSSKFKKDLNENENKGSIKDLKNRLVNELNDLSLNEYIFVEKSNSQYGINGYEDYNNKVMLFGHKDFKYLYSKVTNKPIYEFIIEESHENAKYNFCMIYKTDNRNNLDRIFLEKLNLKKEVITKEIDFYDVSIDFFKLGEGKLDQQKTKFVEDDENGELKYTNYEINRLISDLNDRFGLTLLTKNLDNKVYDFIILTDSKEEIFKSLGNYGFKFSAYKMSVEIFKIDKIK